MVQKELLTILKKFNRKVRKEYRNPDSYPIVWAQIYFSQIGTQIKQIKQIGTDSFWRKLKDLI